MAAPVGNQFATRARVWRQAIECAIEHYPAEPPYTDCSGLVAGLRRAAYAFVGKMMAEKDATFFKEFGDRLEGKPAQGVTVSGDGENPLVVTGITRKIVEPSGT